VAALGAIVIKCLVCDDDLPPIKVTASSHSQGPGATVNIRLEPELDTAWWEAARFEHEECME
jgi:hypothetical protein